MSGVEMCTRCPVYRGVLISWSFGRREGLHCAATSDFACPACVRS